MSSFILETRKAEGEPYPPRSLYLLCCGIQRKIREVGIYDKNFMDQNNAQFGNFTKTLDARMRQLASEGHGVAKKQAEPISPEQENILWEKNLLGSENSFALLNSGFF